MNARIVLVLAASAVQLLATSSGSQVLPPPPQQAPSTTARSVVVEDECAQAERHIAAEATALLARRDYTGLDSLAARLRRDGRTFAQGKWPILFFFDAVADLPRKSTEPEWQSRMQALRDWFENDPDSVTPRVAMARGLINYAWAARGSGWARTVTNDGWRLFGERMTEARRILIAAESVGYVCPVYYATCLRVALVDGSSREQYEALFAASVEAFPTYSGFYFVKANFLLPRWHGEPGEWERFAASAADALGGEAGDMLYAQIVWSNEPVFDNIFRESTIEWRRVQRGFESLARAYPNSISAPSQYCYLAGFTPEGGRALTRTLMDRLGGRIDLSVWKSVEGWTKNRAWAFVEN